MKVKGKLPKQATRKRVYMHISAKHCVDPDLGLKIQGVVDDGLVTIDHKTHQLKRRYIVTDKAKQALLEKKASELV